MKLFKIIAIVLVILTAYAIGMWFIIQEGQHCDTQVTLTDGETHECRNVSSNDNGMSSIRLCDGTTVAVPTVRIKEVIEIKSE